MTFQIGDIVEVANQSDDTWFGPFEVVDFGWVNDFLAGGSVEVLYLVPEKKGLLTPEEIDNWATTNAFAHRTRRTRDDYRATYYPTVWCRKVDNRVKKPA